MATDNKHIERVLKFDTKEDYTVAVKRLADIVADGYDNLVVDLFGIDVLFSRQVSVLIMLHKELKAMNGKLKLINVSTKLGEILDALSLDKLIPMERTEHHNHSK